MRLVKKQKINQLLGEELPEKITSGQVVKGMVLNGLGLVSSPLYLLPIRLIKGFNNIYQELMKKVEKKEDIVVLL